MATVPRNVTSMAQSGVLDLGAKEAKITFNVTPADFARGNGTHVASLSANDIAEACGVSHAGLTNIHSISMEGQNPTENLMSATLHVVDGDEAVAIPGVSRQSVLLSNERGLTHHHFVFPKGKSENQMMAVALPSPCQQTATRQMARWQRHLGKHDEEELLENCTTVQLPDGQKQTMVPLGASEADAGPLQCLVQRNQKNPEFIKSVMNSKHLNTKTINGDDHAIFTDDQVSQLTTKLRKNLQVSTQVPGLKIAIRCHDAENAPHCGTGENLWGAGDFKAPAKQSQSATFSLILHRNVTHTDESVLPVVQSITTEDAIKKVDGTNGGVIKTAAPPTSAQTSTHEHLEVAKQLFGDENVTHDTKITVTTHGKSKK